MRLDRIPEYMKKCKFFLSFTSEPNWEVIKDKHYYERLWSMWRKGVLRIGQPITQNLYPAKWKTWKGFTFDEQISHLSKYPELPLSIGIVLRSEDNLTVIDLDYVLDMESKKIVGNMDLTADEVIWIIETCDSYTEISKSGSGLHIFVQGKFPRSSTRPFEIASDDKFVVLTGDIFENRGVLRQNQEGIDRIGERFFHIWERERHRTTTYQVRIGENKKHIKKDRKNKKNDKEKDKKVRIVDDVILLDDIKELFSRPFWQLFYTELHKRLYGKEPNDFDLKKSLLSVMRREKHPSFWLVEDKNGEVEAFDFKLGDRPWRIQEVYYSFVNGSVKRLDDRELQYWTRRIMEDFNVWTERSYKYKKSVVKFLSKIVASKSFMTTFEFICEKLIELARFGNVDILTCRFVQKQIHVQHSVVSKALRILCHCGLYRKGQVKTLKQGKTHFVIPNLDFDPLKGISVFNRIYSSLNGNLKKFSQKTIQKLSLI